MCNTLKSLHACIVMVIFCSLVGAQSTNSTPSPVVPPLIKFSGALTDVNSKALTGTVGVTFSLYQEAQGGAALWVETQNVTPDKTGHYSVMLGSTTSQGIPASLFASGEARWLSVQAQGQAEQSRTLLMSVPYALKALDAETVGGRPASSFMLAPPANAKSAAPGKLPPGTITGSGTADYVPVFTGASTIGNSKIFQTVGGNVGIGTTTPAAKLDVKGTEDVRNTLTLFPSGTNPALSVHGTALEVSDTGLVTFVSGQTFPGTGTVTGVTAGTGLSGGGSSGNVTLNNTGLLGLDAGLGIAVGSGQTPTVSVSGVPLLSANNAFSGSNSFAGGVGIGTSSGGSLLTISGNTNWGQAEIVGPSSAEASMGFRPSNVTKGATGDWLIGTNTLLSGPGGFGIEDSNVAYLEMSPTGNVGIETAGPGPGVHMAGGLALNGAGSTVLTTQYNGVNSFALNPQPTSGGASGWTLWDFGAGNWAAGITQIQGLVGIGTPSPDANLSVNGDADKPGGGSWGTFSDGRLKNLNGSFNAGLSQVLKIHPIRYRYKADNAMGIHDSEEHIGVVAQDIQKVIPEAVTENKKGYLLVNNDPIIWSMLNAIKEQQKLIQKQQRQIRTQQAQLKSQQSQMEARQTQGQIQQAQIAQLTSQVMAIQASLKTNGRIGSEIRTAKVQVPIVQQ
jgi:Chaperone of endosialidase